MTSRAIFVLALGIMFFALAIMNAATFKADTELSAARGLFFGLAFSAFIWASAFALWVVL